MTQFTLKTSVLEKIVYSLKQSKEEYVVFAHVEEEDRAAKFLYPPCLMAFGVHPGEEDSRITDYGEFREGPKFDVIIPTY